MIINNYKYDTINNKYYIVLYIFHNINILHRTSNILLYILVRSLILAFSNQTSQNGVDTESCGALCYIPDLLLPINWGNVLGLSENGKPET